MGYLVRFGVQAIACSVASAEGEVTLAARNQTAMLAFWPSIAGAVSSLNHIPPSPR